MGIYISYQNNTVKKIFHSEINIIVIIIFQIEIYRAWRE